MEKTKNINAERKGITLIALVITIIVLLILAGITINLTIGQDGILKRAEEAGKNYTEAAEKEETQLAEFSNLTDKIIDNVTKNHYTIVDGVPVPKGFTHREGTKQTGFVIKNDTDGNEFVWVPCTIDGANETIKYDRYAFSRDGWMYNQILNFKTGEITRIDSTEYVYTEIIQGEEQTSIETYGGFYIGRYETGITGYTSVTSTSNTLEEYTGYSGGKAVIKSGEQVWNYITRDKAKKVSEDLYRKTNGNSVNSKLCSSYAWDTTLKFIETQDSGYLTNCEGGNYSGALSKTGYDTVHPCNIYDMSGNAHEWTTEICSNGTFFGTSRGGAYDCSVNWPSAVRGYAPSTNASENFSFRITLYL